MAGDVEDLEVFRRAYAVVARSASGEPEMAAGGTSMAVIADQLRRVVQIGVRPPDGGWRPIAAGSRTPNSRAISRWRWVRPTKPDCGAATPKTSATSPRTQATGLARRTTRRSRECCKALPARQQPVS